MSRPQSVAAVVALSLALSIPSFAAPTPSDSTAHPSIELQDRVDQFYDRAWTRLLIYVTGLIAVVGLGAPAVTLLLQRAQARAYERRLKLFVTKQVTEIKAVTGESRELLEGVKSKTVELEKLLAATRSGVYVVQGVAQGDAGRNDRALMSFCGAVPEALKSGDSKVIGDLLHDLALGVKGWVDLARAEFASVKPKVEIAIAALEDHNDHGGYTATIEMLRAAIGPMPRDKAPRAAGPVGA